MTTAPPPPLSGHPTGSGTATPKNASWRPAPTLYRNPERRIVAGVARGLSDHLGVDVAWLRIGFAVLTAGGGLGVVLYGLLWLNVPEGEAPPPPTGPERKSRHAALAVVTVLLAFAMVMMIGSIGGKGWIWPLMLAALGVAVVWRQADDTQRTRWLSLDGRSRTLGIIRTVFGLIVFAIGIGIFVAYRGGLGDAFAALRGALLLFFGLLVIFGPYALRQTRELSAERRARIRAQERAEVAAHVHDSVLHTLTLIQRHVDDPREVAKLARAQERELRAWLYRPEGEEPDRTFAAALRKQAAEVEDLHGATIEIVPVGDCPVDERLAAQIAAAREAMVNAAKYAPGAPIQVFAEVEDRMVTVFVRDGGPGFDPETLPEDRMGVRESIIGRMRRNGGTAVIRSEPGEGTEVELEMARSESNRSRS
ncbi:ATP-binding protein [Yinghuangia seranimata]|uniref:ATP-binding protein n=1 Tax=Yinghuangia seranimata TaxID=408067 RepID=UPI00248D2929|nr:ATP-binding protein [Yinghuangia seranimata]MDI2126803.1 PspC domain-containing protein [Yinghuangia seranimata]